MSYDLLVFDIAAAPRDRGDFLRWYDEQTQWPEAHGYNGPDVLTPELRAWFLEIIQSYPPMNGPLANDDDDGPTVTDYSLGRSIIYAAFALSQAKPAHQLVMALAGKHGVGFFDASAHNGSIWLPTPEGRLKEAAK